MKYYNLTKSEYKKKEEEFRNTYVGSQRYLCYAISMIVFFAFGIINVLVFCNCADNITMKDLANCVFYAIILLLSGIIATMFGIEYIKHFKEYVNNKK